MRDIKRPAWQTLLIIGTVAFVLVYWGGAQISALDVAAAVYLPALIGLMATAWPVRTETGRLVQSLAVWMCAIAVLVLGLTAITMWGQGKLVLLAMAAMLLTTFVVLRASILDGMTGDGVQQSLGRRLQLAGVIAGLAVGTLGYRWLAGKHLEQTSALFVGLPAMIAIVVVLGAKPKKTTGLLMKAMTVALLISGIFLGEGFICILMASPLFFGIAAIIGGAVEAARRKSRETQTTTMGLLLLVFMPLSFEGTNPALSFPRDETVVAEAVLNATPAEVRAALAARPEFERKLPLYLRMGFPRPLQALGAGLGPGDQRVIRFGGGEGHPGDLIMEVAEAGERRAVFRTISDSSHIAHWLRWQSSEIEWEEMAPGRTRVRWTIRYRRLLDPAFYFGPWERYATRLAAGYLIETVATPEMAR